ncbi:MAG: hypothetical protein R3F14_08895 [Polyangiaceae bacterium]
MAERETQGPAQRGSKGPEFVMSGGSGGMLQLMPPFDFRGVTMRVFPLRASLPRLAGFVDSYLNILPREVGYFRPFLPYVYLMVINYGKMAVEAANMGWIAQNEIAFSVALEWYKEVDGKLVFHDFAYVSPFIYVDNDLSMTTGREVYGWPKSLIEITPQTTSWMEDPRKGPRLATVSAMVFPELYTGASQELRPLLQIDQGAAPSWSQMLPDMESPIYPWVSIPNAIKGAAGLTTDFFRILRGLGITRGVTAPETLRGKATPIHEGEALRDMVKALSGSLDLRNPNIYFNTINLKQFRDSEIPGAFCYQAVTNARMTLSKMNGFGLLGDLQMALGDITGGYKVAIHQWPTHPIIDSLGIQVAHEHTGQGTVVSHLSPVCPMWMDVDMRYGRGDSLAFRARGQSWSIPTEDGARAVEGAPEPVKKAAKKRRAEEVMDARYNTSLGTSLDLTGPFDFPGTTMRVLPLLADPQKLQKMCDELLNDPLAPAGQRFKPWGRYVYLVATSYEEMASLSNNVGCWADNDVVFYVPVHWYQVDDKGHERLMTAALVPLFAFADGTTVAITRSEVSGIPTQKAMIDSPPDTWMSDSGPSDGTARRVLDVTAQVLPVIGMGQPTSDRTLIQVTEHDDALPYNDDVRWRFVADGWGEAILQEHDRKRRERTERRDELTDLKALGVALLTGELPFRIVTLKQFRNASEPMKACYQSLTEIDRVIERVYDVREIDSRMLVRIHRYDSRPIAESLGLVAKWSEYVGATQVDVFQAMRPFWMKVALREELGCRHLWRSTGQADWQVDQTDPHKGSVISGRGKRPSVGRELVDKIDGGKPQRLREHVREWVQSGDGRRITAEQARAALMRTEPQIAIESVLSNEWEHWGNPYWYQAYQEIDHRLKEGVRGFTAAAVATAELDLARETLRHATDFLDLGRPEIIEEVEQMLEAGDRLRDAIQEIEKGYHELEDRRAKGKAMVASKGAKAAEAWLEAECSPIFEAVTAQLELLDDMLDDMRPDFDVQKVAERNPLGPLVEMLRTRWKTGRVDIMLRFSKVAQKPEIFLRRDLLGTEQGRLPKQYAHGPGRLWYVGPDPDQSFGPPSQEDFTHAAPAPDSQSPNTT